MQYKYSYLALAVLCAIQPITVMAQSKDESGKSANAENRNIIQEITVTGRKSFVENRTVTLGAFGNKDAMEIPLAVSSYSSVLIQNQRLRTLTEVSQNDPSIQNSAFNNSYSNLRIRGFPTDWTNTIKRNNLALAPYQDVPMEGVEQVSIIKGPSGFLYGFTPPGGTVNYITKRPTEEAFTSLTVEGRSYGGWYMAADASRTNGDNLGVRINVGHDQVGHDFDHNGNYERSFITAAVDWVINDNAVFQINGDYQVKDIAAQTTVGIGTGALPPLFDPRTLLGEPWLQYETDVYNINPRLDYTFSENWSLTVQMAHSSNTRYTAFPGIQGVQPNGDILVHSRTRMRISPDQTYKTTSGEIFVTGNFETGSISHELVMGVSGVRYRAKESGYAIFPLTIGNVFDPVYGPEVTLPDPLPTKNHNDVDQVGPFISDLIKLSERFEVLLGARYVDFENTLLEANGTETVYSETEVVPNAGVIIRPSETMLLYANYTEGLEQCGVAPPSAVNAGVIFGPLESTSYEVGMKAEILKDINATVSVFEIEKTLEFLDAAFVFNQSGIQRHRGVEVTLDGELFEGLRFLGGLAYLDTTQENTGDVDVNGSRTPNTPELQANLWLDYAVPVVEGLNLTTAVYYNGDKPVDAANTLIVPSFTTYDLGARYAVNMFGKDVVWRFVVKNAGDKRYWAAAESSALMIGFSRTFNLSAQIEF